MVPVVVLGANLNALGVVRSLKTAGMPIYLVSTTRWCAAAWSRECRHVRFSGLRGQQLIEELKSLAARLDSRPVLILNGDREVETISAYRSEIEALYRIGLPSADTVTALADKAQFQVFAEREGFPVPRAVMVASRADFVGLRELALPVVIKPAHKTPVLDGHVDRAVRADTLEQAQEICGRTVSHCALLVQEWIDGQDDDIYFCLFVCGADSRPTGIFCGRKLVCDPPRVGITALCVEAPEVAPELIALTERFTARTHYKGLGSLEVKRDRRNGRLIIVEPTVGRTDWQEEIATLCGTNIPLIAYCTELGHPLPAAPGAAAGRPASVAWRSSIGVRPPPGGVPSGMKVVDGYFRMRDPLPGIYHYLVEELARRGLRRTKRWLRRPAASAAARTAASKRIPMSSTPIAIVGAGPYGLSIAAHLSAAGLQFRAFGTPMESWSRFMPEGMLLRSEPFASNLWDPKRRFTYERFCAERGMPYRPVRDPIGLGLFLEYADWFRRHAVGDVTDVKVRRIERRGSGFVLELAHGESVSARQVVLATGHMAHAYVPPELAELPLGLCAHSSRMASVRSFAERNVAIVGAGQSALETAALLHEAGARVRLLARRITSIRWNRGPRPNPSLRERLLKPEAGLGSGWSDWAVSELPFAFRRMFAADKRHRFFGEAFGPAGAWWLRERVQGLINIHFKHSIRSAQPRTGGVRLVTESPTGTHEIDVDHVVAATGFKLDLRKVDYLGPALNAAIAREGTSEFPLLDGSFETSVPGLFIVGMASAPTFGPVMRFMFGAKHAALAVAQRLATCAATGVSGPLPSAEDEAA